MSLFCCHGCDCVITVVTNNKRGRGLDLRHRGEGVNTTGLYACLANYNTTDDSSRRSNLEYGFVLYLREVIE